MFKSFKIYALLLAVFQLVSVELLNAQSYNEPPTLDELFKYKEVFKYEVKYGFLRLGEFEITMMPDTLFRGEMHKHLVTKVVSNPKIPFVGTEIDHFHSLFKIDQNGLPITSYYWKDNIDENLYKEIEYSFDRDKNVVTYKEEDFSRDTLQLEEPATAGQVILLFTRLFAGTEIDNSMIIYVTKKKGYIHFDNDIQLQKRNYKPWDKPINAYLMKGSTKNIDGPFGFSGKFKAWFLDDELRVPLETRVKVFFGNVLVRIIEYRKEAL